jgi:UDP-N-acetylmuramate--alanine ligase
MNLIEAFCIYTHIACITSMDADHLDIYGTSDAIEESLMSLLIK